MKQLKDLQEKAEDSLVSDTPAKQFMSPCPLMIPENTKIYLAVQMLATHHLSSAPVVNGAGKIVGIISEHDLLIQASTRETTEHIDFTKDPVIVKPETSLREVLVIMYKRKFKRLPVVEKDHTVVGIVTRMDILNKLIGKGKR